MKKYLVVVDMQNDFIDGSLGTAEAQSIVSRVISKIKEYPADCIYATRDTHQQDYLDTQEGRNLPVPHCIQGTQGWEIRSEVARAMPQAIMIDKPSFGSLELAELLYERCKDEESEIELVGLCTDICIVSNAILLKARLPETLVRVDSSCCAGVSPESHQAALTTMKMCQIKV